jgi:hypothetical protein
VRVYFTGIEEVEDLADDLERAARATPAEVRRVAAKGSLNIKRDWQDAWSGHPRIRMLPNTVTYDTKVSGDTVSAEIGPERGRSGAPLANLIEYEFGSVHSAPIPGGAPALERERPKFERALSDLEVRLLEGRR